MLSRVQQAGVALVCIFALTLGAPGCGAATGLDAPRNRNAPDGGTPSCVAQVTAGAYHTCAVKGDGTLWCWGANGAGQLGGGQTPDKHSPVQIGALGGAVRSAAAGSEHTCAVKSDGSLWCWGWNYYGQVGAGTADKEWFPLQVPLGGVVVTVATGDNHTCAITADNTLWCWGDNEHGQLGDGTTDNQHSPEQIAAAGEVASVAAGGGHTCAIKTDGSLWCWGWNASGQLGDGTTTNRLSPTKVDALGNDTTSVVAGDRHTCALTADGTAWCWGDNVYGQLGGPAANPYVPLKMNALGSKVQSIAAAWNHTCAQEVDDTLWCWGDNEEGQTGDGTTAVQSAPTDIVALGGDVKSAATGYNHTCAIKTDGTLSCWGYNINGQVGDGTAAADGGCDCDPVPTAVVGLCP